ncbi:MAG: hypothetical protein HMLKMBBP_01795 [Planctomycetes bacterium]|nr:hypothetical protein [Planctomycetota bacterium]
MLKIRNSAFFLVLSAAVAAAGCASTNWEEVAEQRNRELMDRDAQLATSMSEQAKEAARAEAALAQKAAADKEAQRFRQDAVTAANSASEWQRRAQALEKEMAERAAAPAAPAPSTVNVDALIEKRIAELRAQFAGNKQIESVGVDKDGNIEIALNSDVTFTSGSSAISDKAKKSLKSLSDALNGSFLPYMVRVEGHTDSDPLKRTAQKFQDNLGLGSARALEVTRFLRDELRVDAKRLMSASRGEQEPVAPNDTPANRSKNRRVEIVVVIPKETAAAEAK